MQTQAGPDDGSLHSKVAIFRSVPSRRDARPDVPQTVRAHAAAASVGLTCLDSGQGIRRHLDVAYRHWWVDAFLLPPSKPKGVSVVDSLHPTPPPSGPVLTGCFPCAEFHL